MGPCGGEGQVLVGAGTPVCPALPALYWASQLTAPLVSSSRGLPTAFRRKKPL